MQKITPFLWFDNQAEEAAKFYTSVFKDAHTIAIQRRGPGDPNGERHRASFRHRTALRLGHDHGEREPGRGFHRAAVGDLHPRAR